MAGQDSSTKLLLHCDGANASTTFTDVQGLHTVTANGNAQVSTAQSVFGGASALFDGTGDYLSLANSTDWNLGAAGSGDFTIDFRLRFATVATCGLVSAANSGNITGWNISYSNTSHAIILQNNDDATAGSASWTPSSGTWYHVAIIRVSGTITVYIDGTSIGTITDQSLNNNGNALTIGAWADASSSLNGYVDEFRISKGVARWTANFTPPAAAYAPADLVASVGAYALTGQSVAFAIGRAYVLVAAAGAYAVTGVSAAFRRALRMTAATGSYTYTGIAATVRRSIRMQADTGVYVLTGIDAVVRKALHLRAASGAYTVTGITIVMARKIAAASKFQLRRAKFVLQKLRTTAPTLGD